MMLGLNAVWSNDGTSFSYPDWCNWMPGADYFADCQPPSADQLSAMQAKQLAKIAAQDPAAAAAGVQAGNNAVKALCDTNASDCAAYNEAPKEGASAGTVFTYDVTQTINQTASGLTGMLGNLNLTSWLLIGALGIGALALVKRN